MLIEFDASPDTGGSAQVASIVEIRRQPSTTVQPQQRSSTPSAFQKNVRYYESESALNEARRAKAPKVEPIPPAKFSTGNMVDAVYSGDDRLYRAEVVKVIAPKKASEPYLYGVRFVGYDNDETVNESQMRECFHKGDEVTALLYDTTPGAHAAGSVYVVKENLRRLSGEVVSTVKEGYFIKFKGRGVAIQKTNAFDVLPIATAPPQQQYPAPSVSPAPSTSSSVEPAKDAAPSKSSSTAPSNAGMELPKNMQDREWFEACETSELSCLLRGLKPGRIYEIRIAAASEGGGRGAFGPIHSVKMDAGSPGKPEKAPQVVAAKSSGRTELSLPSPLDDGGSPVTGYQVQYSPCSVVEDKEDVMVLYSPQSFQSLGQTFDAPTISHVHTSAGVELVVRHRVRNKVGWGPWSDVSLVQIPPGPPSSCQNLQVTFNSSLCVVTFGAPEKLNGSNLTACELQYRKVASLKIKQPDAWTTMAAKPNTPLELKDLFPGASYEVRVQASNALGVGPWTSAIFKVPSAAPQGVPSNVQVTVKSHREFEASWDFAEQDDIACGGETIQYETQFVPFPEGNAPPSTLAKDLVMEGQTHTKVFTKNSKSQLKPNTSYWFRIRAANLKGHSAFSPWTNFVMPPAPQEVAVASKLQVERLVLRSTSTSKDLAITLDLDVLPSTLDEHDLNGSWMRIEMQDKGTSAFSAFEIKQWTVAGEWISLTITTGELRPDANYICRAQFVRNGVRGELSKAISIITRPGPIVQETVTLNSLGNAVQEGRTKEEILRAEAEERERIQDALKRRKSAGVQNLSSFAQVQQHLSSIVMSLAGIFLCANEPLCPVPVAIVLIVVLPLAHMYLFTRVLVGRVKTSEEYQREAQIRAISEGIKKKARQLLTTKFTSEKQKNAASSQKSQMEADLAKILRDTAAKDRARAPSMLSYERLLYKQSVVMWLTAAIVTLLLVYVVLATRIFPDLRWRILVVFGMILGGLVTLYCVPGEMRRIIEDERRE